MERRTGRTKRQIQQAKHGALYVWPNRLTEYPRLLAESIGRYDLMFVNIESIGRGREKRYSEVVVDHACEPNDMQRASIASM